MKLNPVNHSPRKNRYCGPAVISAVTGLCTGDAAYLLRQVYGRRSITGTSTHEVRSVLSDCGIYMQTVYVTYSPKRAPTLASWLKDTVEERKAGRVFLVVAGSHWQLISGRRYVCGITREIVSIKHERVKRRARVTEVYELLDDDHFNSLRRVKAMLKIAREGDRKRANRAASAKREVERRLAAVGWTVEVERDSGRLWIYLNEPKGLYSNPRYERPDELLTASWDECLMYAVPTVEEVMADLAKAA